MDWTQEAFGFDGLEAETRSSLAQLSVAVIGHGATLFRPGEAARGFIILLSGRIDVSLVGASGRELLLYTVEPGTSCVQTTLGLLGGEDYTGEATAAVDCRAVVVPRPLFLDLMGRSAAFRSIVFRAFAQRMQGMLHLIERVAFIRIEARLAEVLLERARDDVVEATHQDIAAAIGSAREVVSRRLEAFQRSGWVTTERGLVRLADRQALRRIAAASDGGSVT